MVFMPCITATVKKRRVFKPANYINAGRRIIFGDRVPRKMPLNNKFLRDLRTGISQHETLSTLGLELEKPLPEPNCRTQAELNQWNARLPGIEIVRSKDGILVRYPRHFMSAYGFTEKQVIALKELVAANADNHGIKTKVEVPLSRNVLLITRDYD